MSKLIASCVCCAVIPVVTSPLAPADPTPSPSPTPAAPATAIDHDGTYTIGTQLAPGTYATAGPADGSTCYWKRVGGEGGTSTLENAMSKKPQVVQIEPTDTAFKTDGCQPWQQTDSAPPSETPPWMAQLQLRHYLDVLNGLSGQSGNGQLPPS